eukprot:scaffold105912_cov41-Tisochrysis_lutea.AAC.1
MSSPIGRARSFVGVVVFGAGGDYVLGESLCESKGFCYEGSLSGSRRAIEVWRGEASHQGGEPYERGF